MKNGNQHDTKVSLIPISTRSIPTRSASEPQLAGVDNGCPNYAKANSPEWNRMSARVLRILRSCTSGGRTLAFLSGNGQQCTQGFISTEGSPWEAPPYTAPHIHVFNTREGKLYAEQNGKLGSDVKTKPAMLAIRKNCFTYHEVAADKFPRCSSWQDLPAQFFLSTIISEASTRIGDRRERSQTAVWPQPRGTALVTNAGARQCHPLSALLLSRLEYRPHGRVDDVFEWDGLVVGDAKLVRVVDKV